MITLNNIPLKDIISAQEIAETWEGAFQYHFLYRPALPKIVIRKRALRRSRVRYISVEEYLKERKDNNLCHS